MRELDIDGVTYSLGLIWHTASSPGVKKDIKSFISSEGYSYGVIHDYMSFDETPRNAVDQLTGIKSGRIYQVGATDDEDAKGNISLAKLIASMTVATGVYCLTFSEKEKWVLAVNNGQIVTSTDCILPDEEARLILADLTEALIGTHKEESPFICIVDDDDMLDIFVEHDQDYVELVSTSEQLISSALIEGDILSSTKRSKIVLLESRAGLLFLLGAVVLGGGYYAYGEYTSNKEMQERLRQQASRVIEKKEEEPENQEELLRQAKEEEISIFNKDFSKYRNIELIESALLVANDLPVVVSGWSPQEIYTTYTSTTVTWETDQGTPLGIDGYLDKRFDRHGFGPRGDTATSRVDNKLRKHGESIDFYSKLPSRDKSILLVDALKRVTGESWTLSAPVVKPRLSAIQGIVNQKLAMERQAPYRETEFTIKGSGLHKLRAHYHLLNEDKSMKVISIKLQLEDNNWELKGFYYDEA